MPELLLNVLWMRALLNQLRSKGMPEIMEATLSQPRGLGARLKGPDKVALL
jgi:hypothetical protein